MHKMSSNPLNCLTRRTQRDRQTDAKYLRPTKGKTWQDSKQNVRQKNEQTKTTTEKMVKNCHNVNWHKPIKQINTPYPWLPSCSCPINVEINFQITNRIPDGISSSSKNNQWKWNSIEMFVGEERWRQRKTRQANICKLWCVYRSDKN